MVFLFFFCFLFVPCEQALTSNKKKDNGRRDEQLLEAGFLAHPENEVPHSEPDEDAEDSRNRDGLCL